MELQRTVSCWPALLVRNDTAPSEAACLGDSAMQVGLHSFCVWTLLD